MYEPQELLEALADSVDCSRPGCALARLVVEAKREDQERCSRGGITKSLRRLANNIAFTKLSLDSALSDVLIDSQVEKLNSVWERLHGIDLSQEQRNAAYIDLLRIHAMVARIRPVSASRISTDDANSVIARRMIQAIGRSHNNS